MAASTKALLRAAWGENKPVTGPWDPSLAARCRNGTFIGTATVPDGEIGSTLDLGTIRMTKQ